MPQRCGLLCTSSSMAGWHQDGDCSMCNVFFCVCVGSHRWQHLLCSSLAAKATLGFENRRVPLGNYTYLLLLSLLGFSLALSAADVYWSCSSPCGILISISPDLCWKWLFGSPTSSLLRQL